MENRNVTDQRVVLERYLRYFWMYDAKRAVGTTRAISPLRASMRNLKTSRSKKNTKYNKTYQLKEQIKKEDEEEYKSNAKSANCFKRNYNKKACESLKQGRNTLMCSFVFCYYL